MTIDHEAILRRAHENMARTEEMLSEPRTVPNYVPPAPARYRGYEVETVDEMLKASESRIYRRLDVLEGRLNEAVNKTYGLLDALADEAGTSLGEVERKVRDEYKNQIDALRNEVTLLRAQASTPARRQKPTISRAPFKKDEENAL